MCDKESARVLFADDDPDTLALLAKAGRMRGWCVDTAVTGEEVLERVNSKCAAGGPCYSMIVTDVQFFSSGHDIRMTGMAAAREVRDKFPNLPILFLTGYSGDITRANAKALGNSEVIEKPVDIDYLLDRVEVLMQWPSKLYEGVERRRTSINRSGHMRRATDRRLEVPKVLSRIMEAARRA